MEPGGKANDKTKGAAAIPNRKVSRQPISPIRGSSNPPKIPLIPKMRPLIKMNIAEARPNNKPPAKEAQGVK
jgi:hypothetical protein